MTDRNEKTSFGLSNGTILQGHEEQDYRLLLNLLQGSLRWNWNEVMQEELECAMRTERARED